MRNPAGQVKTVILFLFFLALISSFLYAGGKEERDSLEKLDKAEKLIEEKDYNEAILLLTEIAKSDPDKFGAAEKLIQKIRNIRGEYNRKYEELIYVLFEEKDLSRALELIKELQELDPKPNEAVIMSLSKAKEGAAFVYNLNRFDEIMDKALALIGQQQYGEAIEIYLDGYDLSKEDFDNEDYGNILKNSVGNSLKSLQDASEQFIEQTDIFSKDITRLQASLSNQKIDQLDIELNPVLSRLRQIVVLKQSVEEAALNFQTQNQQIKKLSHEEKYDLYLHFAGQLALGRPGDEKREGIVTAIELMWESAVSTLNTQFSQVADTLYAQGVGDFKEKDYKKTKIDLEKAGKVYFSALDLQALWQMWLEPAHEYVLEDRSQAIVQKQLPKFLRVQERLKEVRDYLSLVAVAVSIEDLLDEVVTSVSQLIPVRNQVLKHKEDIEKIQLNWRDAILRYREIALLGYDLSEHEEQAKIMISEFNSMISYIEDFDINYTNSIEEMRIQEWERAFEASNKNYGEGLKYMQGIEVALEPIKDPQGQVIETPSRIEKHPRPALEFFEPLPEKLTQLDNTIENQFLVGSEGRDYLLKNKDVQAHIVHVRGLRDQIKALQKELGQLVQNAQQDILQAENFKREGLLRLQRARSSLDRQEFETARENLQNAQDAFDRSLFFQEDAGVREIRDVELTEFSKKIIEVENLRVVHEVRELINRGRRYYTQGEFARAEQVLFKARARWADTNPDENKEITLWLDYARAAIEVNTGRMITENDPLFTNITQLYNLATDDYLAGKELLENGKVREALELLIRAEGKIAPILIPFPYNREARILSLKIDQLKDMEGFSERLTTYFNEALKNVKLNPQEAYINLKDLEEIKPDYPGLQKALYNLEIKLKIRIPPPDPAKIAQSRDLYNQALSIVQRNLRDLYPVALDQLNSAIELNPDNQQAVALKDRIQIAAGGTLQAVLSSNALRQFRHAEEKYLEGNYFEALAIVERLLKDQRNRGYPPLLSLKKRIETKI